MTSRGCKETDMETVADMLVKAAKITQAVMKESAKDQKLFMKRIENSIEVKDLRCKVEKFATSFEMPGSE